jgi:hypothetical protein
MAELDPSATLYDPVRKKHVAATPEEHVRQGNRSRFQAPQGRAVTAFALAAFLAACMGGDGETPPPNDLPGPVPGDGYYLVRNIQLDGLNNYVYLGFFGQKSHETLVLGFDETDSLKPLKRFDRKRYDIAFLNEELVLRLKESRDTFSSSPIPLSLCPFKLLPTTSNDIGRMRLRNVTDSSFEILVSDSLGWVYLEKTALRNQMDACVKGP